MSYPSKIGWFWQKSSCTNKCYLTKTVEVRFVLAFLHIEIGITGGSSKITFAPSEITDLHCSWHRSSLAALYISWTQQVSIGGAALQHSLCRNWHLLQGHHFFRIHYRHRLERVIKKLLEIKTHLGLGKKKSIQSSILNGCIYLIYLLLIFSYTWFSGIRFRRCSRGFNLLQFWSNRHKDTRGFWNTELRGTLTNLCTHNNKSWCELIQFKTNCPANVLITILMQFINQSPAYSSCLPVLH